MEKVFQSQRKVVSSKMSRKRLKTTMNSDLPLSPHKLGHAGNTIQGKTTSMPKKVKKVKLNANSKKLCLDFMASLHD